MYVFRKVSESKLYDFMTVVTEHVQRFILFAHAHCSIGGRYYGDQDPSVKHKMSPALLRSRESFKGHEPYQPCTWCQENVRDGAVQGQGTYMYSERHHHLCHWMERDVFNLNAIHNVLNVCVCLFVCLRAGNT